MWPCFPDFAQSGTPVKWGYYNRLNNNSHVKQNYLLSKPLQIERHPTLEICEIWGKVFLIHFTQASLEFSKGMCSYFTCYVNHSVAITSAYIPEIDLRETDAFPAAKIHKSHFSNFEVGWLCVTDKVNRHLSKKIKRDICVKEI